MFLFLPLNQWLGNGNSVSRSKKISAPQKYLFMPENCSWFYLGGEHLTPEMEMAIM